MGLSASTKHTPGVVSAIQTGPKTVAGGVKFGVNVHRRSSGWDATLVPNIKQVMIRDDIVKADGSIPYPSGGANWTASETQVALCAANGITPLLIAQDANMTGSAPSAANVAAYTAFCASIAANTAANYIEIINEPNLLSMTGTQYVNNILIPAYTAIKAAKSTMNVVMGSPIDVGLGGATTATWWAAFFAAGGADYCDVLNFHTYNNSSVYQKSPEYLTVLNINALNAIPATISSTKPVWLTETGYYNGTTTEAVSQAISADWWSRYHFLSRSLTGTNGHYLSAVLAYEYVDLNNTPSNIASNYGFLGYTFGSKTVTSVITDVCTHLKLTTAAAWYQRGFACTNASTLQYHPGQPCTHYVKLSTATGDRIACWFDNLEKATTITVRDTLLIYCSTSGTLSVQSLGGSTTTQSITAGNYYVIPLTLGPRAKVVYTSDGVISAPELQ